MWSKYRKQQIPNIDVSEEFRNNILNIDPVIFIENNLTLDGQPFRLNGNGYKPFADIYRYIGLKSTEPNSKPVVLVKGRQVGATTMAAALECYFMGCGLYGNNARPPMRVIHLFPTLALADAFTKTKLNSMISGARPVPYAFKSNGLNKSIMESLMDTSNPSNDSMRFKKFLGENQIFVDSTGPDGDRIRGRTIDCIMFDEIQDIPALAIGAATKIANKAQYGPIGEGMQVYFGTPKQKGTSYWNMWKMSTQQYFHLHCEKCNEFFPLYHPNIHWEEVWLYGFIVKCTKCGQEQDKRDAAEGGKWIPFNPDPDAAFVGYHINQLYGPTFPKEVIVNQKPENSPINTERVYQNEVLGEFYDGEGATISPDEINDKCADIGRKFTRSIASQENRRVYVGFDWGQRGNLDQLAGRQRGQSYSCAAVITVPGPQLIQIEFATRLQRVDPQSKEEVVDEMFRRYSAHLAVGDIGDAFDLTHVLQRKYPDRFLASRAAPKVTGHIRYNYEIFPKEIIFERDYYISELMGLLKSGNVRFPYGDYDSLYWLVNHCCSMEVKVNMNRSGDPVRRFIKGPTPNDGFMALLNAYLAYKFDITQGFKIAHPRFMKFGNSTSKRRIPAVVGYIPRWK